MKKNIKKILNFGLILLILILISFIFLRCMYYLTPHKPLIKTHPARYALFQKLKYYFPCFLKNLKLESNNIESEINLFQEAIRRRNIQIANQEYSFWEAIIDFFVIDCFVFFYFPYKI